MPSSGQPAQEEVLRGNHPLVSQQHLEHVHGYVTSGPAQGAQLVTGGERVGGSLAAGSFFRPTSSPASPTT